MSNYNKSNASFSFNNRVLPTSLQSQATLVIYSSRQPHIQPPMPHAYYSCPSSISTSLQFSSQAPWLLDSRASYHVTNDLNNLSVHLDYDRTDEIVVGDGNGLYILASNRFFLLSNVMHTTYATEFNFYFKVL